MSENPFAVLTAVVAPGILTNACSVLALNTSNRVARVVDQTRAATAALRAAAKDGSPPEAHRDEIVRLRRRSQLLLQALRLVYAALGGFATSALLSVVGGTMSYQGWELASRVVAWLALVVGFGAVASLVTGCAFAVMETRMALHGAHEDAGDPLVQAPL